VLETNKKYYKTDLTRKLILAVFFVFTLAIGFGLGKVEKANAGYCAFVQKRAGGSNTATIIPSAENPKADFTKQTCDDQCDASKAGEFAGTGCTYNESLEKLKESIVSGSLKQTETTENGADVCADVGITTGVKSWVNCLLLFVLRFLTGMLSVATSLFNWVISADNMKSVMANDTVYQMWTLVRDALNIAFILVLLFSAFCTVFQVSKYNYKNILLTLIIMALLVNFSFPIARVIIDFSNVIMYYLIKNLSFQSNSGSFFVDIAKNSDLGKILYQNSTTGDTAPLIAAVVFTFILAVTLLIIAILFFIRLIVLTILIIFSSVAFVGAIVPFLSSQASKWWDALFKYSFFGPIMIFMIIVATQMMAAISPARVQIQNEAFRQSGLNFVSNMAFFAIPIVILWIGIGFAQQMSIAGASAVVGRGQKFMGWAGRNLTPYGAAMWGFKKTGEAAKFGAGAGAGLLSRKLAKTKYGKFLVPEVYKRAYKRRVEMKDRDAYEKAAGDVQDVMNYVLSFGKEKTDFGFKAHEEKVAKHLKEILSTSKKADYHIKEMEDAIAVGDTAKAEAAIKALAEANNLNDMIHAVGHKYGKHLKEASPENFKYAIADILGKAGIKDEEALAKSMGTIEDIGVGAGNIGLAGMTGHNLETGKWHINDDDTQAAIAAAKFQNMEPQERQRRLHPDSLVTTDESGAVVGISTVQKAVLGVHGAPDVEQVGRSRDDKRRQLARADEGVVTRQYTSADNLSRMSEEERKNAEKTNRAIEKAASDYNMEVNKYLEMINDKVNRATIAFKEAQSKNSALRDYARDVNILVHNLKEPLTKNRKEASQETGTEKKPLNVVNEGGIWVAKNN
jgi:hypothetical protein